jgi:signal transduction histidine kinase
MGREQWQASAAGLECLRQMAGALSDGMAIVHEGRVVWANDAMARIAGRAEPGELVGRALADVFTEAGHGLPEPPRTAPLECVVRRPNGALRTVLCRQAGVDVGAGARAWIVEDLTRARDLEREVLEVGQALHAANRELEALRERMRSEREEREEMLTVVSHELRTPVTVIGGYQRIILREEVGPLTEEQRRFLEESLKACRRLDAFIGKLMEASRSPRGSEILEVRSAPIAVAIEEVAKRMEPLFAGCESRLDVQLGAEGCRARFDPTRVEQVLTNLLENALKYAGPGASVSVTARETSVEGRPMVEVAVADDGPGVPAEHRERIFDPYVQLGAGGLGRGLGLGLAICRRLVEAHGGRIELGQSDAGGARFAFTLPMAEG